MKPRLDVKPGLYRSAKEECKVDYVWILIVLIKTGGRYTVREREKKSTQRDKLKLFKSCRPRRDSVRSWFPTVWRSRRTRTGRSSPRLWSSTCRVPPRWARLSLLLQQHLCARECAASRERAGSCCAPPTGPGPEGSAPPAGERRRRRRKYRSRDSFCNGEQCTNNLYAGKQPVKVYIHQLVWVCAAEFKVAVLRYLQEKVKESNGDFNVVAEIKICFTWTKLWNKVQSFKMNTPVHAM